MYFSTRSMVNTNNYREKNIHFDNNNRSILINININIIHTSESVGTKPKMFILKITLG